MRRMANEFVLDAHALIWFLAGNPRLGINARAAMRPLLTCDADITSSGLVPVVW